MLKPFLQFAFVGLLGFSLWKVGSFFFIPLIFLALKIAFVVGLVVFVMWLLKRNDKDKDKAADEGA